MSFEEPFRSLDREKIYNIHGEELVSPKILVVGCGGAGCNMVNRLTNIGIDGAETVALDTDRQHLAMAQANRKIPVGTNVTRGLGTDGNPDLGRLAAKRSRWFIEEALEGRDLIFVAAGMGGGTGSSIAPIVSQAARDQGSIAVGMVSLPLSEEEARTSAAKKGIEELNAKTNTLIVFDNNRVLSLAPRLTPEQVFSVTDQLIAEIIKGITETVTLPSLINLDYADVKTIMNKGGLSFALMSEGRLDDDPERLVRSALKTPLMEADYRGAADCLLHVTGGHDLTLRYAAAVSSALTRELDPGANVIWGARIRKEFTGRISIMAIMTKLRPTEAEPIGSWW
ncbi:MAG: cell division protein FtsZ [Euryarchaeota archaeon]|nr:cell division protein FtsZ [Euryarchaeota archaeon]